MCVCVCVCAYICVNVCARAYLAFPHDQDTTQDHFLSEFYRNQFRVYLLLYWLPYQRSVLVV